MSILVLGVIIWIGIHLVPSVGRPLRHRLIDALGENPYKGIFALFVVSSIVLMVMGWRSAQPVAIYQPPGWGHAAAIPMVFLAFFLFVASTQKTNVKRFIHHPQLMGVAVWAIAHLLSNGDSRSLVLFGGLGAWALLEMPLINRREGPWDRPTSEPFKAELKPLIACVVAYALFFFLHPFLFGVAPGPATPAVLSGADIEGARKVAPATGLFSRHADPVVLKGQQVPKLEGVKEGMLRVFGNKGGQLTYRR